MKVIFSFLLLVSSTLVFAQTHVGRIVKLENDGTVYVPTDEKAPKTDKLVKYLDRIFKIIPAEKGMKLDNGYVVTTGPKSKIKIVFNNGDHFLSHRTHNFTLNGNDSTLKKRIPLR